MTGTSGLEREYADDQVPPWDIARPQRSIRALAEAGWFRGAFLDAGCGTGEHALLAASLGLAATGVDASPTAVERAHVKARRRGLPATFRVGDARDPAQLGGYYDTAVDSGLLHALRDGDRVRYVDALHAVLRPGAALHVLCFSELATDGLGPHLFTHDELVTTFGDGWRMTAIDRAPFEVNVEDPAPGWLVSVLRV